MPRPGVNAGRFEAEAREFFGLRNEPVVRAIKEISTAMQLAVGQLQFVDAKIGRDGERVAWIVVRASDQEKWRRGQDGEIGFAGEGGDGVEQRWIFRESDL